MEPIEIEYVDISLRLLTKRLVEQFDYNTTCGCGGEWGYGVDCDNPVFMMHHYCWCEKEGCPWCREYSPEPNFHHKASGLKVWWYKYLGRGTVIENPNNADITQVLNNCFEHLRHLTLSTTCDKVVL